MQDIAVQFEKHCWIHSVSLFPPQVHVGRSPFNNNDPISKAVDLLLENTEDLTTVFKPGGLYKELTKRLVEKMLNSEMQNYLGYEKNQHSTTEKARNGTSSKKLITQQGKIEIDVPRDRNSNFTPVIVPKRQRRFDGFDEAF